MVDPEAPGAGPGRCLPAGQMPNLTMPGGALHHTVTMTLKGCSRILASLHITPLASPVLQLVGGPLPPRPGKWRIVDGKPRSPSSGFSGPPTSLRIRTRLLSFSTCYLSFLTWRHPGLLPKYYLQQEPQLPSSPKPSALHFRYPTCHDSGI